MCLKVRPSRLLIVVTTIFAISQASQWSATTRSSHYFLAFVVTHGALLFVAHNLGSESFASGGLKIMCTFNVCVCELVFVVNVHR